MAPLSEAAAAALDAEFSRIYRGRALHATYQRAKLIEYFCGRGEGLTDLPLDVEKDSLEEWRLMWTTLAESAGVSDAADEKMECGCE